MPIAITPGVNLRTPAVLPFFNWRTVTVLLVISFLLLSVTLRLLYRETSLDYLYLLMIVQLFPLAVSISRRHFTYIGMVLLNHFASLSLSKYNLLRENPDIVRVYPEMMLAIKEQIFCTILMILVYQAVRTLIFQGVSEKEHYQDLILTRRQLTALALYITFVPLLVHYLPAWFLIIHFMLLSADMLLLFTCRCPGHEWLLGLLKVGSIFVSTLYFLQTGMLTMMGAIITLFLFTGIMRRSNRSVLAALVFTVVVCSVQSVKGSYRADLADMPSMSNVDRFNLLSDLLQARFLNGNSADKNVTWESRWDAILGGFARAGDDSMERVLSLTPKKVPFWGGETYASIPFMFIPRFLWPDKPSRHFWNKYGRVYGVLSSNDYQTSVGVSYLAEGYMNFGYPGMYGVAIFVAFLIAMMERFSCYALNGYFCFTFLLYLLPMMSPATDLGSMLNSLFLMIMITAVARQSLLRLAQRDEYS